MTPCGLSVFRESDTDDSPCCLKSGTHTFVHVTSPTENFERSVDPFKPVLVPGEGLTNLIWLCLTLIAWTLDLRLYSQEGERGSQMVWRCALNPPGTYDKIGGRVTCRTNAPPPSPPAGSLIPRLGPPAVDAKGRVCQSHQTTPFRDAHQFIC